MKTKLFILAIILVVAAIVVGIIVAMNKSASSASDNTCAHEYTVTIIAPTCTAAGNTEHKCSKCEHFYKDCEITALGHDFVKGTTVIPSFESEGYTDYVCSRCGIIEKRNIVERLTESGDDSYVDTVVAPTCTEKGYTERKYNADGRIERIDETEALGHNYVDTVSNPTCTNDGYVQRKCTVCGNTINEVIDKLGHDYTDTVVPATCVDKGYTLHVCKNCEDEYRDAETKALGHSYKTTVKAPTCTEKGYTTHTCSVCGNAYKDNEKAALGHNLVANKVVAPTVSAQGYTIYKCTRCDKTEKRDYVSKLPDPDEGKYTDTVVPPTCKEKGYTKREFEDGRVEYIDYVEALGHNYVKVKTVAPTCLEDGYELRECTRCDSSYKFGNADPLGHNYTGPWILETPATTTADGNEYQVCSRCGGRQYRLIPKIGGDGVVKTDKYMQAHYGAGRFSGERKIYEASDSNPICIMIIGDYTLKATVVHTGYLAFRVTFVDNTGTTQVIDVRYEYDNEYIFETYSCRTLDISADGSYTLSYGRRLG